MTDLIAEFRRRMNSLAGKHVPFLFIIDYEIRTPLLIPLDECLQQKIYFSVPGRSNYSKSQSLSSEIVIKKTPPCFEDYLKAFTIVQTNIHKGNSYLVNLTFPSKIESLSGLEEIFHSASAAYKLLYKNDFLVFSPECFIKIAHGKIKTYPMKGTMDASIENAEQLLLQNEKETAEHATIVDLLRNDLSRVAENVVVEKYRYLEKIVTSEKTLLQASSVISGKLSPGYNDHIGDIILSLLPAGSICGAPKNSTLKIISEAEPYSRGYYTGVFGIYDGETLDSGVMIRYIENQSGNLIYKSGGGITSLSKPEEEYNELIDKVYVPIS